MEPNLREKLLEAFEGKLTKTIEMYLETCSRCGICTTSCHVFNSMPRPEYSPAARAEVVRRLYKKYFKLQGKILPSLGEAKPLDDTALDDLDRAAYSCTGCRRCMTHCPFGIDFGGVWPTPGFDETKIGEIDYTIEPGGGQGTAASPDRTQLSYSGPGGAQQPADRRPYGR